MGCLWDGWEEEFGLQEGFGWRIDADGLQYGGSPVKVGDEEYSLFRDYEYVSHPSMLPILIFHATNLSPPSSRLLAKINE